MGNQIIQRYQIKEKIGAGGMGTVYRAWDHELERDVALKWLPAYFSQDQTFTERFKREIRVIAHLEHPHIVPIYDVGESEGRPFIIMRLLDGGTLRDKIQRGNFNLAELVQAIEQIAGALAAAHARQIVHRDIKPGNILFDNHGSAFLSDFGIAKVLDSSTHLTGSGFIGTPAYMSPEQFTGQEIDGRSDQYSLAVVVYEALKGDLPFEGTTAQMMYQHINVVPPDIDLDKHPIPPGLNPILLKSLSKDPADRYARVTDFATAMAIAIRMDPATSSVLLPVMVGAPPPGRQRPPTAPTELDTTAEEMDTVGNDYRAGLEALALGEWAAALAAFDRVLSVDPNYGNAAGFSRQAQTSLEKATAQAEVEKTSIEKTKIEPVPPAVGAVPATAVAVGDTLVEPETSKTGTGSHPASQPPDTGLSTAVPSPAQEPGRKVPLWALALLALLLLICGGIVARQMFGGSDEREPSATGGVAAVAGAAVASSSTEVGEVLFAATETTQPPASATPLPQPSATDMPIIAGAKLESGDGADNNSEVQSRDETPKSVVGYAETEAAEETPTGEASAEAGIDVTPTKETPTEEVLVETATAEPQAQPAAVRVIVSSANLRRGPGTIYPTAGAIFSGEEATVLATNQDRTWYNVELADGGRAWLAASVTEVVNAAAMNNVPVAATIPAAPTFTPVPPTATPLPTLPPPTPTTPPSDGGGGGGSSGGGSSGSEPPPKYTAEPP
jgi:hypothetical protein